MRILALLGALALAGALSTPALAMRPNAAPTVVAINGDGTITVTTEARSRYCDPASSKFIGYGGCNLRITDRNGIFAYPLDGNDHERTLAISPFWSCPCTAQFWEHAGQWHPYSAVSEPFTP